MSGESQSAPELSGSTQTERGAPRNGHCGVRRAVAASRRQQLVRRRGIHRAAHACKRLLHTHKVRCHVRSKDARHSKAAPPIIRRRSARFTQQHESLTQASRKQHNGGRTRVADARTRVGLQVQQASVLACVGVSRPSKAKINHTEGSLTEATSSRRNEPRKKEKRTDGARGWCPAAGGAIETLGA